MKSSIVLFLATIALSGCLYATEGANLRGDRFLTADNQCNFHGTFNSKTNSCVCVNGYTTHDALDGTECNYEQKKQLTAFFLSLFLGYVSAGRWYAGTYALAGIKLAVTILMLCFESCAIEKDANGKKKIKNCCAYIILLLFILAIVAWWLADVIMFGLNDINDENGVALEAY